ncbi:MAG: VOC family protein [Chloroflexota bacterium]|nr:VOC family protein [Chloroflexota bacterium]MDP9471028.1 VOC family protein [Chloroflexota bacterium]
MTASLAQTTVRTIVPQVGAIHHLGLTVSDIEASEVWYSRVLGLTRAFVEPHHGGTGYAVVLHRPDSPLFLGLDKHEANRGERFDEGRTGLDHVSFHVADRSELDAWVDHFDRQGVQHSGIAEFSEPFPFAVVVFRDPDNIQLELIWQ